MSCESLSASGKRQSRYRVCGQFQRARLIEAADADTFFRFAGTINFAFGDREALQRKVEGNIGVGGGID
jgi:hypothetical protein